MQEDTAALKRELAAMQKQKAELEQQLAAAVTLPTEQTRSRISHASRTQSLDSKLSVADLVGHACVCWSLEMLEYACEAGWKNQPRSEQNRH